MQAYIPMEPSAMVDSMYNLARPQYPDFESNTNLDVAERVFFFLLNFFRKY